MVIFLAKSALDHVGYVDARQCRRGKELGIYVTFSAGVTGGAVTIEGAPSQDYAGIWAPLQAVPFASASSTHFVPIAAVHGSVRARITTAVENGTVDAHYFGV